jgi:predicted ABC-type ATPase
MSTPKTYSIFAGVNGAGKSAFFRTLKQDFGVRINVDEILKARQGHEWDSPKEQVEAGRVALALLKECLCGDVSFNQETTLTGYTIVSNIKEAKANGFKVDLYYIGLSSIELSMRRVLQRLSNGGHGISDKDLMRRYTSSFENLKLVMPLCDRVHIYDNSSECREFEALEPFLIVNDGIISHWNENCPQYLKNVLDDYIATLRTNEVFGY